jgi:uncharacterized protein YecT (DUF1311 family)
MINCALFYAAAILLITINNSFAASFDCAKAQRPLEKLICSNPQLNSADEQMGQTFKEINASFPLKGFALLTQRRFIADYPTCMLDGKGKTVATPATANACLQMVQARIAELRQYGQSKVYSNAKGKFTQDDLAILITTSSAKSQVKFWGNWMPDAYQPAPFPQGRLCEFEADLIPAKGGFKTDQTDDVIISISDAAVQLSGFISCSPRTGIADGTYKRIK